MLGVDPRTCTAQVAPSSTLASSCSAPCKQLFVGRRRRNLRGAGRNEGRATPNALRGGRGGSRRRPSAMERRRARPSVREPARRRGARSSRTPFSPSPPLPRPESRKGGGGVVTRAYATVELRRRRRRRSSRRRVGARAAATSWARPRRAVRGRLMDASFSSGRDLGPAGLAGLVGAGRMADLAGAAGLAGTAGLAGLAGAAGPAPLAGRAARQAWLRGRLLGRPWLPSTPEAECHGTRPGRVRAAAAGEAVGRGRRTRVLLVQAGEGAGLGL